MTYVMDHETVAELEKLYKIRLTDAEREWLTAEDRMLTPLDRQRRFLLATGLEPLSCPGCHGLICRRSAGGQVELIDNDDDAYACPLCHAALTWHLGLFGGQQSFTLSPGQTVTVPPEPEPERGEEDVHLLLHDDDARNVWLVPGHDYELIVKGAERDPRVWRLGYLGRGPYRDEFQFSGRGPDRTHSAQHCGTVTIAAHQIRDAREVKVDHAKRHTGRRAHGYQFTRPGMLGAGGG